jgi:hypothetical protein
VVEVQPLRFYDLQFESCHKTTVCNRQADQLTNSWTVRQMGNGIDRSYPGKFAFFVGWTKVEWKQKTFRSPISFSPEILSFVLFVSRVFICACDCDWLASDGSRDNASLTSSSTLSSLSVDNLVNRHADKSSSLVKNRKPSDNHNRKICPLKSSPVQQQSKLQNFFLLLLRRRWRSGKKATTFSPLSDIWG